MSYKIYIIINFIIYKINYDIYKLIQTFTLIKKKYSLKVNHDNAAENIVFCRGNYFQFGSVFIKKNNQTKIIFLKKNRNRVKPTGFGSFGSVFRAKTGSNRFGSVFSVLDRFFPVLAWFFWFGSVFPVWLCFFSSFLSVSVRFGFFSFLFIKPKPNWSVFSKI